MKPTESAQEQFKQAHALMRSAQLLAGKSGDQFSEHLAKSLTWFYGGCHSLSEGIRATYILLEKVNKRLDDLEREKRRI